MVALGIIETKGLAAAVEALDADGANAGFRTPVTQRLRWADPSVAPTSKRYQMSTESAAGMAAQQARHGSAGWVPPGIARGSL